jgi:rubrerythrin
MNSLAERSRGGRRIGGRDCIRIILRRQTLMSNGSSLPKAEIAIDRRGLFTRSARLALSGTTVALLAGIGGTAALRSANAATMSADIDTLNVALGLEHEAIAAYQVGAESGLLTPDVLKVAVGFQSDHKQHRDVLAKTIGQLGGTAVADVKHKFPVEKLKSQADVLRFALGLEIGAASAYLSTIPGFDNRELAKAAASIMGVEAQHVAILKSALGSAPIENAFIS